MHFHYSVIGVVTNFHEGDSWRFSPHDAITGDHDWLEITIPQVQSQMLVHCCISCYFRAWGYSRTRGKSSSILHSVTHALLTQCLSSTWVARDSLGKRVGYAIIDLYVDELRFYSTPLYSST